MLLTLQGNVLCGIPVESSSLFRRLSFRPRILPASAALYLLAVALPFAKRTQFRTHEPLVIRLHLFSLNGSNGISARFVSQFHQGNCRFIDNLPCVLLSPLLKGHTCRPSVYALFQSCRGPIVRDTAALPVPPSPLLCRLSNTAHRGLLAFCTVCWSIVFGRVLVSSPLALASLRAASIASEPFQALSFSDATSDVPCCPLLACRSAILCILS